MRRNLKDEHIAWQKYKKWQKTHKDAIREGQEITSLHEFQEIYRESGRRLIEVKNEVRFQMSKETYNAFNVNYKDVKGHNLANKWRSASTQELAELLLPEINEYRKSREAYLMDNGLTAKQAMKQARLDVSMYYFGS